MSYVFAAPELLTSSANSLAGLASSLTQANAAAAGSTTNIILAAQDEVSAAISALFSQHGLGYQQLASQAAAFQDSFVQTLTGGAGKYSVAEAANAAPLDPFEALTGRPLFGNGANGAAGTGADGGAGRAVSSATAVMAVPVVLARGAATAARPGFSATAAPAAPGQRAR